MGTNAQNQTGKENDCFNRCEIAKNKRDIAWKKMRRRTQKDKREYKLARSEHVKVRKGGKHDSIINEKYRGQPIAIIQKHKQETSTKYID